MLDSLLAAPVALAILVIGLVITAAVLGVVARRIRANHRVAIELLELAQAGRSDKARIQARNEHRDLAPVLDALGGEAKPPTRRPRGRDLPLVLLLMAPVLAIAAHGLSSVVSSTGPARVDAVSVLLLGVAVLLPTSLVALFVLLDLRQHSARRIRGIAVTLLARGVKLRVEQELSEALRRGNISRDPRAD